MLSTDAFVIFQRVLSSLPQWKMKQILCSLDQISMEWNAYQTKPFCPIVEKQLKCESFHLILVCTKQWPNNAKEDVPWITSKWHIFSWIWEQQHFNKPKAVHDVTVKKETECSSIPGFLFIVLILVNTLQAEYQKLVFLQYIFVCMQWTNSYPKNCPRV